LKKLFHLFLYTTEPVTTKMNTFQSEGFENFIGEPSFYPSEADLNIYLNRESLLRRALCDTEFDCYSDVSIDTSSALSFDSSEYFNWAIQGKKNRYFRAESFDESLMQYGRGPLTHSESQRSSQWSDDEMSELLSFEESLRRSSKLIMDEEEEIIYLAELAHQDMVAAELGWCHPGSMKGSVLNIERTLQDVPGHFLPTRACFSEKLLERIQPNRGGLRFNEGVLNVHRENTQANNNPIPDRTLPNPNNRRNNSEELTQVHVQDVVGSTQATMAKKESSHKVVSEKRAKTKKATTTNDDGQRVFLGGLPIGITERTLRQHLAALGYKVLKRPKILHGFAPEVWMRSVEQAKDLIEKGVIMIDGLEVEVRPYNSLTKLSELKKLPNVGKRSVFIGGLSPGTTTKNLQDVLLEMGMKVINYPVIKHGFARQVILDTIAQAKTLIKMRKIQINGTSVDVRPFVNQRRRRRTT